MNRTFTFLWVLLFSMTLFAQKATEAERKTYESPAAKLQKDFFKRLGEPMQPGEPFMVGKPGQIELPESTDRLDQEFDVKSGRLRDRIDGAQEARLAPAAAKQRLDSIVGHKSKTVYTYDEDGNVSSTVEYRRDTVTDSWTPFMKAETIFDENGRTAVDADYYWDDSLKQWVGDWKWEYTRDQEGRTTRWQTYEWDAESGQWVAYDRWDYGYDGDGNQTTFTIHEWDAQLGEWVGIYTEQYNYDENGNSVSSSSSDEWDAATKQFKPQFKMELTRDVNGMVTNWVESRWDEGKGEWVNTLKGDNTIDANGNYTSYVWSEWDTVANEWVYTSKNEFTFDANNNNTSNTTAYWNADSNRWDNAQKWEYIYEGTKSGSTTAAANAGAKLIRTVYYIWYPVPFPGSWIAFYKTEYTYDGDGNRTKTENFQYDMMSQDWVETDREESTFDERGYPILSIRYVWNADSNGMIIQSKNVHTYDANGYTTHSASYGRDYLTNNLIGWSRTDYVRDEYGNNLSISNFVWNMILNDWVGQNRFVYTYDYAFPYADLLLPFYMQHKILQYIVYAFTGSVPLKSDDEDWEQNDIFIYHYTDLEVGVNVDEIFKGELSIFPNPASDYIEIGGDLGSDEARVLMYNVSGRIVMDQVLDRGGRIPVSHLSEGIYVIRLQHGNEVKTGKVMIE